MSLTDDAATLTRRSRVAIALLVVMAFFHVVSIVRALDEYAFFTAVGRGAVVSHVTTEAFLSQNRLFTNLWLVLIAVTATMFIAWQRLAVELARTLTSKSRMQYEPSDATWAWFIPFVNLGRPYLVMSDLWLAADPDDFEMPAPPIEPGGTAYRGSVAGARSVFTRSPPLRLWWATFAVGPVAAAMVPRDHDTSMLGPIQMFIRIDAAHAIAAVAAVFVVIAITRDLTEKALRATLVPTTPNEPAKGDLAAREESAARGRSRRTASSTPWWIASACALVAAVTGLVGVRARIATYTQNGAGDVVRERFHVDPSRANGVANALFEFSNSLASDPEMRSFMGRMQQRDPVTLAAAARGLTMLPEDRLAEWSRLRLRLANASPETCAALWFGRDPNSSIIRAMASLDDASIRTYLMIQRESFRLGLSNAPAPVIDETALATAIAVIRGRLPPERLAVFNRTLASPTTASPEAACATFIDLYAGIDTLPAHIRGAALRMRMTRPVH